MRVILGESFGKERTMSLLRVATLNIWNKSGPWLSRLPLIQKEIERISPEILGLQEALRLRPPGSEHAPSTAQNDQATEIGERFGFHVAYAAASDYGNGLLFGNALLSRHPIVEQKGFMLPHLDSGETRSLLYALCDTPLGHLPVFVTHLNWKFHHGLVRQAQVAFISERIAELAPIDGPSLPPVLMGDFNAEPDSDEIRYLGGRSALEDRTVYFGDAWVYGGAGAGYTFCRDNGYAVKAREPSRRIDYIFVRGPDRQFRGEPMHTEIAFNAVDHSGTEPVWPSDHFGLYTDLELSPRRF
jgi:endonuclease/exonuclease/phosphatase family metal-dependent hydrolase